MQVVCGHSLFLVFILWFRDNLSLKSQGYFSLWNPDCTVTILYLSPLLVRKTGFFPTQDPSVTFYTCYDIKMFPHMWEDLLLVLKIWYSLRKLLGFGLWDSQTQAVSPDNLQTHLGSAFHDSLFKANIEIKVNYYIKM